MRARDKARTGTLRLIMAEVKKIEVDERIDVDDQRMLAVLDKMKKQRIDSAEQYEAADRADLAQVEKDELAIIETFPQALTEDEANALVAIAITESGAASMQDMGKVMGILNPSSGPRGFGQGEPAGQSGTKWLSWSG